MNYELKAEIVEQVTKASPPISVGVLTIAGVPLSQWVLVLTAIYTMIQIGLLVDRIVRDYKRRKHERSKREGSEGASREAGD